MFRIATQYVRASECSV